MSACDRADEMGAASHHESDADLEAPLHQLRELCDAIAAGQEQQVDVLLEMTGNTALPETIRALAEAFGMMIVRVEAREMHLEETLEKLREAKKLLEKDNQALTENNAALSAEIDRLRIDITSRDEAVREIIDTDQFREVRQMARALRDRFP